MPVHHVEGDLFAQADLAALGHGVNCRGVMGAGIAVPFKRRFAGMFEVYAAACADGSLRVGGCLPWLDSRSGLWVYNLASQERPGADARLDAVASSLDLALTHAEAHAVPSVGLPRIGSGIGGLAWDSVRDVIEQVSMAHPGVLVRTVTVPGQG